jgi:hypothetical protein
MRSGEETEDSRGISVFRKRVWCESRSFTLWGKLPKILVDPVLREVRGHGGCIVLVERIGMFFNGRDKLFTQSSPARVRSMISSRSIWGCASKWRTGNGGRVYTKHTNT